MNNNLSPAICAVIVTWFPDSEFLTRLDTVMQQADRIIVVDNASTGDTLLMLCQLSSTVTLISNTVNLGVASAFNIGVKHAQALGFQWVLLLDQDSRLAADMLASMRCELALLPTQSVAVLGAKFIDPRRQPHVSASQQHGVKAVDWVISSGSLIAVSVWQTLHGFREDFFIDFVDTEYCLRAQRLGYQILQTQAALMRHCVGEHSAHHILGHRTVTSNHSADRRYYITRNFMVMLHESDQHPYGGWIVRGIYASFKSIRRIVLYERDKRRKLAAIFQGWQDGIMGRMGQRGSRP